MAENKNSYLNILVQRAMGEKKSPVSSRQFGTPTQEKSRTHSVGEEGQSRTRSVGTAVSSLQSLSTEEQANAGQPTSQTSGQKPSGKKGSSTFLKGLISGTMISDSLILKDIRYSLLILILGIIFIANRFSAEKVEREIAVLEQEVRDTRAEALSVSADLGSVSRQSEITDLVKERGLGLEELREPPYRIVVNE
jgi:hypothetical protein